MTPHPFPTVTGWFAFSPEQTTAGRWAWILSMALLLPIGLPAGGARLKLSQSRQRQPGEPLLAAHATSLRREPLVSAPQMLPLPVGQPLQGLVRWHDGQHLWLRVTSRQGRGWVRIR